jgi:hypothetical protein
MSIRFVGSTEAAGGVPGGSVQQIVTLNGRVFVASMGNSIKSPLANLTSLMCASEPLVKLLVMSNAAPAH